MAGLVTVNLGQAGRQAGRLTGGVVMKRNEGVDSKVQRDREVER
jgi:hypothetical protein